ncbi:MAG TPA: hypothetical protein VKB47_05110 [Terracidiphilus sp.]|nr:hypothetical protein [Terracidiphilus sp.]
MKKYSVYYLPTSQSVMTNIHVWAGSAAEAVEHIEKNGVGYHNGPVFAHRIVAVEMECEMAAAKKVRFAA